MKYSFLISLSILINVSLSGQTLKPNISNKCSNYLGALSYFWKLDSLGHNGFRLYTYERMLNCDVDEFDVSYLIEKLGKPNFIDKDRNGTYYCYYYYDGMTLPKEANLAEERMWLHFYIPFNSQYVKIVGKGHDY